MEMSLFPGANLSNILIRKSTDGLHSVNFSTGHLVLAGTPHGKKRGIVARN